MGLLDTYTDTLNASSAAHLLRRATFGPTQQEIVAFTGKTAAQAVDLLFSNSSFRLSPPPPVEMDVSRSDKGQPFLSKPYVEERTFKYHRYIQYWWIGLMAEQNGHPSILEKLSAFWQNHFVVSYSMVEDYRFTDRYLRFLRNNALGNFRTLATEITKDPAMLIFQNGNENSKDHPNENYGRELQELFTVGQKDFHGNHNYTESDVRAAAMVLTGWQALNKKKVGSTSFSSVFTPARHDTTDKQFSSFYNNKIITGRSGTTAGDEELNELITMLLNHPETPKFIVRKLYRWFVNHNVTQEIEDQVIIPLANLFSSSANNFEIAPVLKKLLTSNIFYDRRNVGAMIKSPAEFMIGMNRFFEQPVPDITTEYGPFRKLMDYLQWNMSVMQLDFLDQPLVFGFVPYYQTGYSKNWINGTTIGIRGARSDMMVNPWMEIKPGYLLGVDLMKKVTAMQRNFSDVAGTPAITCEEVFAELSKNLFAIELTQSKKDFLMDTIMMGDLARSNWTRDWNAYRTNPTSTFNSNRMWWRLLRVMQYMLRMAEYQLF